MVLSPSPFWQHSAYILVHGHHSGNHSAFVLLWGTEYGAASFFYIGQRLDGFCLGRLFLLTASALPWCPLHRTGQD